jgi:uncharacterized protein (TIGR02687 family)
MNIDYEQAKKQLISMLDEQIGHRHIIFWYDAQKNFLESLKGDSFPNAKVLIFENNPFTLKTILEIDDPTSNYLVYYPAAKPKDAENWLEDISLYSEEYYADSVALTMRKLNLASTDLRGVVEKHIHFFDSQVRVDQFNKKISPTDETSPMDFELGMMSVLAKNPDYSTLDYVLREIIFDDLDGGEEYQALEKYGFKDLFWQLVGEHFSYSGLCEVKELRQTLLLTAMAKKVPFTISTPILSSKIMKNEAIDAIIFVNQMLMQDKRYEELDKAVYTELRIGELMAPKGIDSVGQCDVFSEFDGFVSSSIISALSKGSYDYDSYLNVVNNDRVGSKWYSDYSNEYNFILAIIDFYKKVEIEIPEGKDAEQYIHDYAGKYWVVDNAYRHLITAYMNFSDPTDEETAIVKDADNRYETKFLAKLGSTFSNSLKTKEPDYSFGSVKPSIDFFRNNLNKGAKKQFVIISDALRYEVAQDLVTAINQKENFKGRANLTYQVTTLPSITMFGMAALLPHQTISYVGKQVLADGKPTNSTLARDGVLKQASEGFAAIQYETIVGMNKTELREYMKDKSLVYIYHDTIDNAGEHDEGKVFPMCERAIEEIVSLINKLYNVLQISNYYVTSDHGFIYRNRKIGESTKYPSIAFMNIDDYSGRYAIVDDSTELAFTNKFSMSYLGACKSTVMVPYGYDLFKKAGGGIQYIHGGASLQEIITPIVTLSEMRATKSGETSEPVKVMLKSVNRKIMNKSFHLQFEQMEKVGDKRTPASVKVYFIDENKNVISDEKVFVANKTTDDEAGRTFDMIFLLKNLDYDRDKRYYLVMENAETGDPVADEIPFVIDIVKFKLF